MYKRWNVPFKKVVLEYAELCGRDSKSYRSFDVPKSTFYEWRKVFRQHGAAGLIVHLQNLTHGEIERRVMK